MPGRVRRRSPPRRACAPGPGRPPSRGSRGSCRSRRGSQEDPVRRRGRPSRRGSWSSRTKAPRQTGCLDMTAVKGSSRSTGSSWRGSGRPPPPSRSTPTLVTRERRRPRLTDAASTAPTVGGQRTRFQCGPAPPVRPRGGVRPGQPEQIERDEVGRPLLRRPGRPGTTPGKPVRQPLEREAARGIPYDQLAVQRGRVRQLHGPGHDLRKRRPHLGAAPGAVAWRRSGEERPETRPSLLRRADGESGCLRESAVRRRRRRAVRCTAWRRCSDLRRRGRRRCRTA